MKVSWFRLGLLASVLFVIGAETRARASLVLTVENAGVQTSPVAGVNETFDSITVARNYQTLATAVGQLTSSAGQYFAIRPADQFGGAGGTGNYFALGADSNPASIGPVMLTFGTPQAYFGFWWSAADSYNQLSLYSSTGLLGSFNAAAALGVIGLPHSPYLGNPNTSFLGDNLSQPYAYLNFYGTSGTTITSVVFFNGSSIVSSFEADNFTIDATQQPIHGTPIPGLTAAAPEPCTVGVAFVGAMGMIAYGWWRRRRGGLETSGEVAQAVA